MDTIQLLDGSIEIIGSTKDFGELIEQRLGVDAKLWFDDLIEDYQIAIDTIDELWTQIEDARNDI